MIVGVLIPTLHQRPEFLQFTLDRLKQQTLKPSIALIIDYPNEDGIADIAKRYKEGITELLNKKVDLIAFIEDDDYYPLTYIEELATKWDSLNRPSLIGCKETIYYHLPTTQYLSTSPKHCSAFCTAVSKGINTDVCKDYEAYFDYYLWQKNKGVQVQFHKKPIGIKHGIGTCGGNGHNPVSGWYKYKDYKFEWLRKHVDSDAFDFYINQYEKIKRNNQNAQPTKALYKV